MPPEATVPVASPTHSIHTDLVRPSPENSKDPAEDAVNKSAKASAGHASDVSSASAAGASMPIEISDEAKSSMPVDITDSGKGEGESAPAGEEKKSVKKEPTQESMTASDKARKEALDE